MGFIGDAIGAVAGGLLGGNAQEKAAKKQAQALKESTAMQVAAQKDMFGQAQNALSPYMSYGTSNLGNLQTAADTYGQEGSQWYNALAGLDTPQLQNKVAFDLENDPIYQQQVADAMKALNRRFAGSGRAFSSDADNAILRNRLSFMQDSYGRSLADLNRANQNALTMYGLDASKLQNLYGMANEMDAAKLANYYNMVGIGSGAAGQLAGAAQNLGTGLAGTYANQGTQLANVYGQQGANQAQNYQDTIAGILGAYNNYNLNNSLQGIYSSLQGGNAMTPVSVPTFQADFSGIYP